MPLSNSDFPNRVRSELVRQGSSVHAWARENRLSPATVYAALNGTRKGKRSERIVERLNRLLPAESAA